MSDDSDDPVPTVDPSFGELLQIGTIAGGATDPEQELLANFFQQQAFRKAGVGTTRESPEELQERMNDLDTEITSVTNQLADFAGDPDPGGTLAVQRGILTRRLVDLRRQQEAGQASLEAGGEGDITSITRLEDDDPNLDPDVLASRQIERNLLERSLAAARGEIDDPTLNLAQEENREIFEEGMRKAGLGPGSTPYDREKRKFLAQQAGTRSDMAFGRIGALGAGLVSAQQRGLIEQQQPALNRQQFASLFDENPFEQVDFTRAGQLASFANARNQFNVGNQFRAQQAAFARPSTFGQIMSGAGSILGAQAGSDKGLAGLRKLFTD